MNCKNVKKYLTLVADDQAILKDYIVEHINNCETCKKYYKSILKTKEIISEKPHHNSVNIDIELNKIKQKIEYTKINSTKQKIYNILFKNTTRKIAICAILCIIIVAIPLNNTSIVKGLSDFWCNKIIFHKSNIKIEEGNYKVDISKDYPEQYMLLQERDNLIKKTISLEDNEIAYKKIDEIVEEYDDKIWNADKKGFTVKFEDKKYTDFEQIKKELNLKLPKVQENFKFAYGIHYIDDYHKILTLKFNDTNNNNRLNNIRKPLYIKYVYFNKINQNQNASLQEGTKFKEITIGGHEGYLAKNINSNDNISLSASIFMENYNVFVITDSNEKDLQENEQLLLNIITSLIS